MDELIEKLMNIIDEELGEVRTDSSAMFNIFKIEDFLIENFEPRKKEVMNDHNYGVMKATYLDNEDKPEKIERLEGRLFGDYHDPHERFENDDQIKTNQLIDAVNYLLGYENEPK